MSGKLLKTQEVLLHALGVPAEWDGAQSVFGKRYGLNACRIHALGRWLVSSWFLILKQLCSGDVVCSMMQPDHALSMRSALVVGCLGT